MAPIYFDLSEQFHASGSKLKYYGIARTVMEVGYELSRLPVDVRYVVFSPAHGRFFEVTPRRGTDSPTGLFDPGLPPEATPARIRKYYPDRNVFRDLALSVARIYVRRKNLKRWSTVPADAVKEVDLQGQTLVSLARPKLMVEFLDALRRDGTKTTFYPMLYDMIPLREAMVNNVRFPGHFVDDNRFVIETATAIMTISDFTRREVEGLSRDGIFPKTPPVIAVPLSHEFRPTDEPVEKTAPAKPYLLCVGTDTGRKNVECVVNAMAVLDERGRQVPHLVLAGAFRKRIKDLVSKPEFEAISDRFHFVLDPNQAELERLYRDALALVIPTRMEGWGLPLGEALWLGTPGLSATADALKEVGGDVAQYFEPDDSKALADLIDPMLNDPQYYADLKTRVKDAKPQLRSWADVAKGILAAVETFELGASAPEDG